MEKDRGIFFIEMFLYARKHLIEDTVYGLAAPHSVLILSWLHMLGLAIVEYQHGLEKNLLLKMIEDYPDVSFSGNPGHFTTRLNENFIVDVFITPNKTAYDVTVVMKWPELDGVGWEPCTSYLFTYVKKVMC